LLTEEFQKFIDITKRLRKECPWDREQTHASIRSGMIEEAFEAVDAIDANDMNELRKELGDVLLQVVFHSNLAEETSSFTLEDVITGVTKKMIDRHPHVFGTTVLNGSEEVKTNWEKLKMKEGRKSVMDGVPQAMPALMRAQRLQEKASKVGFDWDKKELAWKKVEEELAEFKQASADGDKDAEQAEFGDLLFSLVNYGRFLRLNSEDALRGTVNKFVTRFQHIEKRLKENGKDFASSSLEEMDKFWEEAKTQA
jgi:XTP/dITP diphosphohydrolase